MWKRGDVDQLDSEDSVAVTIFSPTQQLPKNLGGQLAGKQTVDVKTMLRNIVLIYIHTCGPGIPGGFRWPVAAHQA